jgi:hypothetical protein
VNGKEKEHNEAGVSAKINPLNISMTASKQTEAARGLLKSRGSDSERYIGASISSSTHLLRKLSNTSLRRLGLKENGFASTSRMKDEDCSPDSKAQLSTSRMNSSSTSRGKVDLYAGRTTGGSKAALLLAEALRAPYFDRLSAEGRKALAGSRALAHKEVRRTATGASVDSAHNLYTRQATSLAAPSK